MMTFVSSEKSTTPVRANLFGSATEGNAPCGMANPKGGLAVWSDHTLMGFEDDIFKITPMAIDINDTCALNVAGLRFTADKLIY